MEQKNLTGHKLSCYSVLPMRFCEKVGFFSGTDKATAEGGTSLWGSEGKILKIAMQIEPFLQHLGKNSCIFPC